MSLVIGIGKDSKSMEYKLAFEPEVFYWVMGPEIDHLSSVTGKYIDLYDGVTFQTIELVHLKRLIKDLKNRISSKPEYWQEFVGKQTHPEEKDLYTKVSKSKVLEFISQFESIVDEAESKEVGVVFDGD
ncbi:hypothetical protein [Microbulbifer thermotolerans]|uniref:hypothetical protein n=1 Tax=Microbulbifer thermotolerans TaxID=252514 RepID=UPI00224B0A8C|nr:hypothetical protein [Microbulbifer thermotolerans]MCX2835442.1 hypothetical protein [Microbulbifer thermotolerans]